MPPPRVPRGGGPAFEQTEAILRQTLQTVEQVFGVNHPYYGTALENLAAVLERAGRLEEAASAERRAVDVRNAVSARIRTPAPPMARGRREASPAVLDIRQTARYLAVSMDTLYKLVRSGEMPHVRIGKSIRFRPADVDRFLDERITRDWTRVDGRGRPPRR